MEPKEDLLPVIKIEKPTIQNLQESIQINGYVEAKSMIPVVLGRLEIDPAMQANSLTKHDRRKLVELLKKWVSVLVKQSLILS